jgi:hypothetical protein
MGKSDAAKHSPVHKAAEKSREQARLKKRRSVPLQPYEVTRVRRVVKACWIAAGV